MEEEPVIAAWGRSPRIWMQMEASSRVAGCREVAVGRMSGCVLGLGMGLAVCWGLTLAEPCWTALLPRGLLESPQ